MPVARQTIRKTITTRWWLGTIGVLLSFPMAEQTFAAGATGPLRVHPTNPRYFTDGTTDRDGSLKVVYLTGSHTWDNLQDMGETDPPGQFDFNAYLDFLAHHDHNFIRLWRWELTRWNTGPAGEKTPRDLVVAPHPWARTGPGMASDGKPKFNLEQFDEAYFHRLRARVTAARDRGIYVSIMLFEGWGLRFVSDAWMAHPFHPSNNINGLEKDPKGIQGNELFTLASPRATALQEAYVRKVIETVNDLDNVLYEISNESDFSTTQWQYHVIHFIRKVESAQPKQHPIGMTSIGGGVDDLKRLLESPADWISPNADRHDYRNDPPASDGAKVIILDTDHLWGLGGNATWVWKSFARGVNPIFMDLYQRRVLDQGSDAQWESIRRAMGVTRRLAERIRLTTMMPKNELASTGYCLAHPGSAYVVYLPEGGEAWVDLSAASGSLTVEWLDPHSGTITHGTNASGGAKCSFQAPFNGDAVLSVRREE
ncbi:MAG: DUF6298 domain-containing protein [Pirellulaceae bacterium]